MPLVADHTQNKRLSAHSTQCHRGFQVIGFCLSLLLLAPATASAQSHSAFRTPHSSVESVSFRNDVMAVLSKAGCNAGTCHGNKNGKGGFALSLRGEDWRRDFDTLTRRDAGRRVNRFEPPQSLLLLKPSMAIPHEGGRRFRPGDPAYRILHDW